MGWAWSRMYIFWGPAHQTFERAKKSKIRLDFEQLSTSTANILKTDGDIKTWKQTWSRTISTGSNKKLVKFGPLTKKLQAQMLTHPKSALRVLRILMHWSLGHVTLLPGEFQPPKFFLQIRLRAPGGLTLGLAPNC